MQCTAHSVHIAVIVLSFVSFSVSNFIMYFIFYSIFRFLDSIPSFSVIEYNFAFSLYYFSHLLIDLYGDVAAENTLDCCIYLSTVYIDYALYEIHFKQICF